MIIIQYYKKLEKENSPSCICVSARKTSKFLQLKLLRSSNYLNQRN